jgi:hypothetical protein
VAEGARLLSEYAAKSCIEGSNPSLSANSFSGEMAERPKARAWKARVPKGTVGSNPTLSAKFFCYSAPPLPTTAVADLIPVLVFVSRAHSSAG